MTYKSIISYNIYQRPATSRSAVMRSTDWANPGCSVWDSKQYKISKYVHRNTTLQHWRVLAAWCSKIKHYTVVLSHSFRPRWYEEKLSRKRGSLSSWVNGKNSWLLCPSQQCSHILWLSRLDQVDPAGRAKVFVWRNNGSARRVTLPSQKGEPAARRVTLLAKPIFFTFTRFATVFNPLNHKIKIWILICCPYSFPWEVIERSW